MKELSLKEAKTVELNILLHINEFCKKNNLRYFLAYGTLIGAVRHNGFIPWDDDIDINMPRKDYNWLMENYNKMNPNGRYKLISPYSKEAKHSFIKIIDTFTTKIELGLSFNEDYLGIDIDVFPIDGQPESELDFNKLFDRLRRIYRLHYYCQIDSQRSIKRRIGIPIIRMLTGGKTALVKKAEKLHSKYQYDKANYVGVTACLYINKGDRYKKECVDKSIDIDFEGYKLPIPAGYDEILTNIYGDYMKLPPEEKRVTHHANKMFIKDGVEI